VAGHIPVLLKESIELLMIKEGNTVVDATFGGGGHTVGILESESTCVVTGVDRDNEAAQRALEIKKKYPGRFSFLNMKFSELCVPTKIDAILFDFGISSFQIDDASRGFSFTHDGPLDMRMSSSTANTAPFLSANNISALEVVNTYSESDLSDIIYNYGNEKKARKIAKNIIKQRRLYKIDTTFKLKSVIDNVFGNKKVSKIENATRTFQAIRIYVNDELYEISNVLSRIPELVKDGGRIVTISFHSLEDRIVKLWQKNNNVNIKPINNKVIKPSRDEIRSNPRSRSAVMRGFIYNE
jgi:16S rRNA (cytosine1402-N4)-methyltransferase